MGLQEDVVGDIGAVPRCKNCGSARVVKDAWACWNPQSGLWELEAVFDFEYCCACDNETSLAWSRRDGEPNLRVRDLNDRLRQGKCANGRMMLTPGIVAKGEWFVKEALAAVRDYSIFTDDPWGEHDFGGAMVDGERVYWKIDAYNLDLSAASEDPGNEGVTCRVLTLMLPEEY